jgi:hypothetical protein
MAFPAPMRFHRACLLVLVLIWPSISNAQSVTVRTDGDQLRAGAADVHFLNGESLRKLHDGMSVNYLFQVSALTGRPGTVMVKTTYRFVISYDLWEEKFAVTRVAPEPRSISHLSVAAAEAACLDALLFPLPAINPDMPFWVRVEYQTEESPTVTATGLPAGTKDGGISLGSMIDIFSGKKPKDPVHGSIESSPVRLSDLRKAIPSRGAAPR